MFKRHNSPLDAIEGGKMQSDNAATVKGPSELSSTLHRSMTKTYHRQSAFSASPLGRSLVHPIPKCSGRIETIFVGATVRRTLLGLAQR